MFFKKPEVNYLKLRPNNLLGKDYRHLLLLLYWPIYGALFGYVENGYEKHFDTLGLEYHEMYLPIDDLIPFNEFFVIPYMFWFGYIVLSLIHTLLYDVDIFKRMSYFIMITYTSALISYYFYPTIQCLRPETFARDNFLVDFMKDFYAYDTNTNVCPSVHVFGSISTTIAFAYSKGLKPWMRASAHVWNLLIILSTVFLKQHSIIDIIIALAISAVAFVICFRPYIRMPRKRAKKSLQKT